MSEKVIKNLDANNKKLNDELAIKEAKLKKT